MSNRHRIYVASSWRNPNQPVVVHALRSEGHEVYDFKHPAPDNDGFSWRAVGNPDYNHGDLVNVELWRQLIDHPVARQGFKYDFDAMKWCDTCVYVLPAGRSASFELGWCMGQGKRGIVLALEPTEPELMFREAALYGSIPGLLAGVAAAPPPTVTGGPCRQSTCSRAATKRVSWPGQGDCMVCDEHAMAAIKILGAMGITVEAIDIG